MLMCWNEEPQRRPKFTELRSKFDAMLLAERKDAYIDLRIDNDKPYYRLDTTATIAAKGLHLSPNPSRHSFKQSSGSGISSRNGSKECSLKPLHTPEFSPSHKSEASCYNSSQMSPRKQGIEHLPPSSGSFGRQFPFQGSCENAQRGSDVERRGRARAQEQGRPVSLLLPRDQERRDRQNPYVDEPSRAAATILAHSNGSERRTRRGSDGMIEMNPRSGQDQNGVIEILITGEQT